jgi:hypothetical protein
MYIRIVRRQTQPGQVDEFARLWQEFMGQHLPNIPEFRHGYFTGNREANTFMVVNVWDSLPDPSVLGPINQQFLERVEDIAIGPPAQEEYEVLAEI